MPIGQVDLDNVTTEEIFERLTWFYATVKQITLFDADGRQHKISNLIISHEDAYQYRRALR